MPAPLLEALGLPLYAGVGEQRMILAWDWKEIS